MKTQQENLRANVPASTNPAKRYAGQLVGRWITFFCSGALAAVARHWKSQINEMAKAPANVEILPDANHNSLAGIFNPSDELLMPHTLTLFLRAASDHPRNILRANLTRQTFMIEGLNTDFYLAHGDSPLAQMWTAIHFGDYMAYYLSMAYGSDPRPSEVFASLKDALAAHP
jgi:glucose/mannose-6-phosphate isomerase